MAHFQYSRRDPVSFLDPPWMSIEGGYGVLSNSSYHMGLRHTLKNVILLNLEVEFLMPQYYYGLLHIPIYRSSRWLQCLLWTSHRLVYTVVEWRYCLPWTVEQCQQLAPKVFYIHLGMYTHMYSINDTMQIFYTVFMVYTRPQNWSDGLYQLLAKNITLEVCLPASIFSFSFSKLHTELHSTMLGSFLTSVITQIFNQVAQAMLIHCSWKLG